MQGDRDKCQAVLNISVCIRVILAEFLPDFDYSGSGGFCGAIHG
jgi:hypothetical protein